jgi:hypothetical protein
MTNIPLQPTKVIPHWLAMTLCILFAILYGVWLLPNTIFIRNTCLIAGAVLSLWVIYQNRGIFYQRRTWPLVLIACLLIWVSIHLFFIGLEFDTQLAEYTKIWKKIALGCVFAMGLGLAIGTNFINSQKSAQYWLIARIAFLLPVTIYFLKLIINAWAIRKGIELSPYLQDSRAIFTDPYAIPRPGYVFFILPGIALAIGSIVSSIEFNRFAMKNHLLDLASLVLTIACLFIEHDKLGVLLVILLLLAAGCTLTKSMTKQLSRKNWLALLVAFLAIVTIALSTYRQNAQWSSLIADAKVAVQVDAIDDWKYENGERLPVNQYGVGVNPSNYQRISWAVVGSRLAIDHPLGYGLMSQSFGRWCKLHWPESHNSWAHNAWLDFTLGYGYPGTLLLLLSGILAWRNSKTISQPWNILGRWGFGIMACTLFFKELSSEIYFNAYIFLLVWVATLALMGSQEVKNAKPD